MRAGTTTWVDAASGSWAMDPHKAERVDAVLAVDTSDIVVGAWAATGVQHAAAVPAGGTRLVSRSSFALETDERLRYLVGAPSFLRRRRNPQTVLPIRDLPGGEVLVADAPPPATGVAIVGGFVLRVTAAGHAEVIAPAGAAVLVRTTAATG